MSPPIRSILNEIGPPDLMRYIPLRRQNEIIVTDFLEIALLPLTSVDKGDFIFAEGDQRVRL